ncbi:MAG TPA: hypothetical protein VH333_02730 [Pseudonocardiaceae bacterium]|nr:hypothetical protein [Pseudonocardiaceae bacterium]
MSLSSLLSRIGISLAALCVSVVLSGVTSGTTTAPSDDGGTGSPPPSATTTVSPDDGNPWHG